MDPTPPPASTSSTSTFLSSHYLSTIPPDSINDLQSFLDDQRRAEQEAREAMPFQTGECSWERGYVKQSVWACRDCDGKGVCYGCSISCHAEHDLVELFQRRKFRCDCPTSSRPTAASSTTVTLPQAQAHKHRTLCTLVPNSASSSSSSSSSSPHPPNTHNRYTRNFTGQFCRCSRGETYDPMEEEESMVVCLGCEEWFHEGCLNLYDPSKPPPSDPEEEVEQPPNTSTSTTAVSDMIPPSNSAPANTNTTPITTTSITTTTNNPALIRPDAYAHLVCRDCITKHRLTRRLAGTKGWMMILPRARTPGQDAVAQDGEWEWADRWEVVGKPDGRDAGSSLGLGVNPKADEGAGKGVEDATGTKRKAGRDASEAEAEEQETKRPRLESTSGVKGDSRQTRCILPDPVERAQKALDPSNDKASGYPDGQGDVFLAEGEREKLAEYLQCGCEDCQSQCRRAAGEEEEEVPFPLTEEDEGEVYEPPREEEEDGPEETIDEMTAKALNGLPRSQAIETMIKFNEMKDNLKVFLEGFRGTDKVVKEEDIQLFVAGMRERAEKR